MNPEVSISVNNLSKDFFIRHITRYGGQIKKGKKKILDGISFEVYKGEIFGIIGNNGSGKSTLLKTLVGLLQPDGGTIELKGKVASVLELEMGFDLECSGYENIEMCCRMYGLGNESIKKRMDSIISFSELGDQIDCQLKTYSSGMRAKLAFSIITNLNFDILIMDELLSVGDPGFNLKCKRSFMELCHNKKSIIITSHNLNTIMDLCDRIMWLENGKCKTIGEPESICFDYNSEFSDSFEYVIAEAKQGNSEAMNKAGVMCKYGIQTPVDVSEAKRWFIMSAERGNPEGQFNLADILIEENKINEATYYLKLAADSGNNNALIKMQLLSGNLQIIKDKLLRKLEELSKNNSLHASLLLADIYLTGTICPKQPNRSFELYEYCAKYHILEAEYKLGLCYRDGVGTERDSKMSEYWLNESAKFGYTKSVSELIKMYTRGIGVQKNMDKAIEWLSLSASKGNATSMLALGRIYAEDKAHKNDDLAQMWFENYSLQSIIMPIYQTTEILRTYENNENDIEYWYNVLIESANAKVLSKLYINYLRGVIVKKDLKKANDIEQRLATIGNASALTKIGTSLLQADNDDDNKKAFDYLLKAAMNGDVKAIGLIIEMYEKGVRSDDNEAELEIWKKRIIEK